MALMLCAAGLHLDPAAPESLAAPSARAAVLERIRALTSGLPYYAQPRAVWLTLEPWTTENTMLTPTLKPKRNNLAGGALRNADRGTVPTLRDAASESQTRVGPRSRLNPIKE